MRGQIRGLGVGGQCLFSRTQGVLSLLQKVEDGGDELSPLRASALTDLTEDLSPGYSTDEPEELGTCYPLSFYSYSRNNILV